MKIIEISGGLGNQLFIYIYYLYMKKKYNREWIFTFFPRRHVRHNGFELTKWFDVQLYEPEWSKLVCFLFYWISRILRLIGLPVWFMRKNLTEKENVIFHEGYWQDKKYLNTLDVHSELKFKAFALSRMCQQFLQEIQTMNSVAIHIRRGDFLKCPNLYGEICTPVYYTKALSKIKEKVKNPIFFVFSDDLDFAKSLLKKESIVVVDCNRGENSFFDMYLMSQCKNMILANSTFSYWAAILNKNHPIVVCPDHWTNIDSPDIIMNEWITIKQ